MDVVDQKCDKKLKIVNRRYKYYVSKKFICSVVPYFKKIFYGDKLKSKKNKVTLDFDERAFDALLNWIHTELFIMQMDYVISFYEVADYLMIKDRLFEPCINYFYDNFTIEHIPAVLSQISKSSILINSQSIGSFICRHFLKIVNTDIYLDYPVETIEHILKLDLMVHSEYQVFESIIKWVNKNTDSRKEFLTRLLDCVRWSFMDPVELPKVKENELIKTLRNFDSSILSNGDCGFDRSEQNFFVSLQILDDAKLRINIFDKGLFCLPIGDFTEKDSMSIEPIHEEHISDILFDYGIQGVRIDWIKKTFTCLGISYFDKIYYKKMNKLIVDFQDDRSEYSCYLDAQATELPDKTPDNMHLLLEYNDGFVCIGETYYEKKYFGIFPVTDSSWFNDYTSDYGYGFHATILDKSVYVLTSDFNFFQFNMETRSFKEIELFKGAKELTLDDLILTSLQKGDDKVILVDKLTGKFYIYCVNQRKWFEKYQILNVNLNSIDSSDDKHDLLAFTSTFLPIKNIKPLFRRSFL